MAWHTYQRGFMKHSVKSGQPDPAAQSPSYLILQGLASPFFKTLAQKLATDGASVHRVNFCGGDWWFGGGNHKNITSSRFNGTSDTLYNHYIGLIETHAVSDIIIFGDCRPLHTAARSVAADKGLTIWVFEEGYTRPGYITCEEGGCNDLSILPRTADAINARARLVATTTPSAAPSNYGNPMPRRVRMDFAFHFWNILLRPLYFRYRSHRPEKVSTELLGWAARLAQKWRYRRTNAALIRHYETGACGNVSGNKNLVKHSMDNAEERKSGSGSFFMVPLQLNSDFQIRIHSDYENILDFIREVVASFARHAPKSAKLMFKGHPLDNGLADYRNYIAMAAIKHDIQDRVDFIDGGSLDLFLHHAAGLVLINSTVGYAALAKAKAMKVMGRALYNMAGLTDQRPLDKFWKKPDAPDPDLIADFLAVIRADSQISGDFFTKTGIETAATTAALRIQRGAQYIQSEKPALHSKITANASAPVLPQTIKA